MIGRHIGAKLDEADRIKAAQALESSATGQSATWKNPDTGAQYTMTPTYTYESQGSPCRDFRFDATIEGKPETVEGTACRQPDGNWKTKAESEAEVGVGRSEVEVEV
jgi:surface antigen